MLRTIGISVGVLTLVGLAAVYLRRNAIWLPESPFAYQERSLQSRNYNEPWQVRRN